MNTPAPIWGQVEPSVSLQELINKYPNLLTEEETQPKTVNWGDIESE